MKNSTTNHKCFKYGYFKYLLVALIFLNLIVFQSFKTSEAAPLTIRVGAYENPPKIYSNPQGDFIGFFPMIVESIARSEGWTIEWVNGTWSECEQRLLDGEIDMMVDMAWSEEREEDYDFNEVAVIENWGTIYTNTTLSISTLVALEGMTIAVMTGNIHTVGENGIINLLNRANVNVTYYYVDSLLEVFQAINDTVADVGVVNRLAGLYYEDDYEVKRTPIYFNPVDLKFAFQENNTLNLAIIPRIDFRILEMKEDPDSVYYDALELILGDPVIQVVPDWVFYAIAITIGLVVITSFASVMLKKKVNDATAEIQKVNRNLELANEILIDTIPAGVLVIDFNGMITIINDIFKKIFFNAYGASLNIGVNLFSISENDIAKELKKIYHEFYEKHTIDRFTKKASMISLPNQTHFEIFHSSLTKKSKNDPDVILFVFHEVTPFIEIERMRKQFISTVSHELRTPIASITLTLENLIKYKDKISEQERDYMTNMMSKSGKVLADMIEDLLITSRIDNAKIGLTLQNVDILSLMNESLIQLQGKIEDKKTIVLTKFPSVPVILNVDPKRFGQIIRIFLDNAIKYSPEEAEVEVEVLPNSTLMVDGTEWKGTLITVQDHGIGIPAKDLSNLFTRFHRAGNVGNIVGTGLGLNIAKELIELHHGKITVESKEGEGTTFKLLFP